MPSTVDSNPRRSDGPSDPRRAGASEADSLAGSPAPIAVLPLLRDTLHRLRQAPVATLGAWLILRLLAAALLAPVLSASTNWMIARTGRYVVANEELVRFALSPVGVAVLVLAAVVTGLSLSLARAAVLLVARERTERSPAAFDPTRRQRLAAIARAVAGALRRTPLLVELAARQLGSLALLAAPLAIVVLIVAWLAVRGVDLYWLVTVRPQRFWIALAVAAPCALLLAALAAVRVLRWSIALPLCVLEQRRPRHAMVESAALLRGELPRIAAARLAWFGGTSLLGAALLAAVHLGSKALLARELGSLGVTAAVAGAALAAHAAVLAVEGLVAGAGDTLLLYAIWRRRSPTAARLAAAAERAVEHAAERTPRARTIRWAVPAAAAAVVLAGAATSTGILSSIDRPLGVSLTAHRGASRAAPENTAAAIREAIRLGADRVELDVMLTRDNELVVFHDVDLRRIAGDPRRIADLTLAEIQQVDVGSWFDPRFAAERAPSLAEALEVAGWHAAAGPGGQLGEGGFPLNLELKTNGDERELAAKVAAMLKAHGDDRSIVTSLSVAALDAYRRVDPERRIGAIVTASVGDLHRIDVDLYSVNAGLATPSLIDAAHALGREVHAWSVTDPDHLTRLALRGVDGVITSDVEPLRARLEELAGLDDLERLLLAFRARLLE